MTALASCRRIGAMIMRHVYVMRSSWPRLLELVYWPTVQLMLWAFITRFLMTQTSLLVQAGGLFLSAVLLWDTLFRCQLGMSLTFMEEMWARNLGHLFVSPLRPFELVLSLFVVSLIRTLIGVGGAALLAIPFYDFWIGDELGPALIAFFAHMILFGWAMGLIISALVMRLGLAAESLAWGLVFMLQPLSGVYYPIAVLPEVMQRIAWLFPPAWVFEGMRAVLIEQRFDWGLLAGAAAANLAWMGIATVTFVLLFRSARNTGRLLQVGE
ncbi:MAG TPA: ABC transporter permease [Geminicoccaceae bacterium]|nr:ABC transporter permease [Geminicoccaceae bacterium]